MFEKVNPCHPDKVADRIAGAIVDLAYQREEKPRCAVEVLIGHGYAYIIIESSVAFSHDDVEPIVQRIAGNGITTRLLSIPQDQHLADNQVGQLRCGDNGIFKGSTVSWEEEVLTVVAGEIYKKFPTDGKYILSKDEMVICQSQGKAVDIMKVVSETESSLCIMSEVAKQQNSHLGYQKIIQDIKKHTINPLGDWTGGCNVDSGATNRKLGSDMGGGVTGGGLHGKDLSKADVSVNIVCHLMAQDYCKPVVAYCAIGDESVTFGIKDHPIEKVPYELVVKRASEYIHSVGGFEHFAEWGLIRP